MSEKPTYEELKKTVFELKQGKDDLNQIFSMSLDMICIVDIDTTTFLKVNPAFTEILGFSESELLERPFFDFVHHDDIVPTKAVVEKKLRAGTKVIAFENRVRCKDGSYRWLSWTSHPVLEQKKAYAIARDITALKKATDALDESKGKYKVLIDNMNCGVAVYEARNDGEDFIFVDFNKAGEKIDNISKEDLIGKSVAKIFPSVKQAGLFDVFKRVWETGNPESFPISFYKNERLSGWRVNYVYKLPCGEIVSVYSDETLRMQAEEALKKSEDKYRGIIENANESIIIAQDGMIKFVNPKSCEISGFSIQELMSKPFVEFVHPDDQAMVMQQHIKRLKSEEIFGKYEFILVAKDGNFKWVENNGILIEWEGKPATLNFITDRTDQKRDQKEIKNAKEQWEATFNAIPDWVSITNKDYKIIQSNKASKKIIGLSHEQIVGKLCYKIVHELDHPIMECPQVKAFKSNRRETMEFKTGYNRWLEVTVDPIETGPNNKRFVHIVRDITVVKDKENELVLARKAKAFSVLSGGIAHDYNNLLTIIWGNISLLREEMTDPQQAEFFDEAEKACRQARDLTHQFITLSHGAILKKTLSPVEDILNLVIKKAGETKILKLRWILKTNFPQQKSILSF